jgi:hypothetical protein
MAPAGRRFRLVRDDLGLSLCQILAYLGEQNIFAGRIDSRCGHPARAGRAGLSRPGIVRRHRRPAISMAEPMLARLQAIRRQLRRMAQALIFPTIVGEQPGQFDTEWTDFCDIAAAEQLQDHQQPRGGVMGMDEEVSVLQVGTRHVAQPPNDPHPAIIRAAIDEGLTPQVVVQTECSVRLEWSLNLAGEISLPQPQEAPSIGSGWRH